MYFHAAPHFTFQSEEACSFFRHTRPYLRVVYRLQTDSPDPTADGISDRAFADTGKTRLVPVDNR